ncbi:AAA family ATPase [Geopsychrobacter electrodiphilus]|uniref:AAA family ATPase n=1 Tax=Geopsychrobacter electrodiphilus TaxID=225196 RepID=UPI00037B360D|nr:MoxR family ATPase [Geopsychrobacter electrodiphilus]
MQLPHRDLILQIIDNLTHDILQGKVRALRIAMICLLSGGHLLIEDIPGLGKTSLALALSKILGLSFGRVQCTSDLLPSDITGLSIFDREKNNFRFIEGPIFSNLVLLDEVNRTMPKTQSAMLEAMEERRVTLEGKTYSLPDPFMVIATQNPAEQIGTFALPESQLDRFLAATGIGYPPPELERQIIQHGSIRHQLDRIEPLLGRAQILETREAVAEITLGTKVAGFIYDLVEASRQHPLVLAGISTRGGINLADAARAEAYLKGRNYVVPEDVQAIALPVTAHRLILKTEYETQNKQEIIRSLLQKLPVPMA